jgi:glycerophosphoryl diester phosphodiesterase
LLKKILFATAVAIVALVLYQAFYGGLAPSAPANDGFDIVAHRGMHTNWQKGAYDLATGCEATHIYTPTHPYIENTIASIGAAFDSGATVVEIDIRRTSDDHLVIFHDDRLECRTDGQGTVGDHTLEYLRGLDIGYGYSPDGGRTYPFRGQGVGRMPTLIEVLEAFPDQRFWIDHKDGSMETAQLLVDTLKSQPLEQQASLYYWGPPSTFDYIRQEVPSITRLVGIRSEVKECFLPYLLSLGLAGFPEPCRGMGLGLPPEYVRLAWGWPYRFLDAVHEAGLRFYLLVDTAPDAHRFRHIPVDGIITDYIEVVGPYFQP